MEGTLLYSHKIKHTVYKILCFIAKMCHRYTVKNVMLLNRNVISLTPSPTHTAETHANSLGQLYTHTAVRQAELSMSCF
jgi:hypothetical protein